MPTSHDLFLSGRHVDIPTGLVGHVDIPTGLVVHVGLPTGLVVHVGIPTGLVVHVDIPTSFVVHVDIPTGFSVHADIPTGYVVHVDIPTGFVLHLDILTGFVGRVDIPTGLVVHVVIPTGLVVHVDLPTGLVVHVDIPTGLATAGSGVDPLGLRQYKVRPSKDTISSVHNDILKSTVPCAINTVRQKAYSEVNAHPSGITLQDSIDNARVDAPGQARTAGQSTHSIPQSNGGREIPTNQTAQAIQKAVKKPRAPRKPKPPKTKQPAVGTNVPAINGGNAPTDSVSAATGSENAVAPVKPAGKVAKKPRRPKQPKPKQAPGAAKSLRTDAQAVGTASGPDVSSEDRELLKFTSADKAGVDISSRCPEKTDVDAVNGTSGELKRPRASDQPTVVKSGIVAISQSGVGSAIGQVAKQLKRAKVVKKKDAGKSPGKVVKTKAKTKPKSVALTDAEVQAKLLEYLRVQNRPYSATDVYNNLGGTLGKTAVTKALAEMASTDAGITEKVYGKQKVYCVKQVQYTG
ncbi:hypothetical protein SARC_05438 [Sphaeroforma arctica JP610]|uniref:Homologous-pairing protein 2 winged helix domain-containing protein n=1 Tax=Sphaeroforma arctica JP610 TaxID=667725 RepID=A0A0L0G0A6_9EUKA|nr:hypothetical protein SARC_05438 [Sphaeroforma arctica JP610]KNC82266.1 hypothetical protein SARC_05438 [Sphaeroforma arctica JP610]|eukprot:XP_014156168.1 hypothetical protein SARC_05438 [Sphaeroforma arctica JP610]